jgi:hypothetical protein
MYKLFFDNNLYVNECLSYTSMDVSFVGALYMIRARIRPLAR